MRSRRVDALRREPGAGARLPARGGAGGRARSARSSARAARCGACSSRWRAGRADRCHRARARRERAPARSSSPAPSTSAAPRAAQAARARELRRAFRESCSRASSSATCAAPSPARSAIASGRFQLADGGTLFLDEVGEIPLELQVQAAARAAGRRIRARRRRRARRRVDVRVIAATNRDLERRRHRGPLPRRPVLPARRLPDRGAAAARPPRRHSPARDALHAARQHALHVPRRASGVRIWRVRRSTTGRATCANCRTSWSAPSSSRTATRPRLICPGTSTAPAPAPLVVPPGRRAGGRVAPA